MFTDIYTTTPCQAYNMGAVEAGARRAALEGFVTNASNIRHALSHSGLKPNKVWVLTAGDKATPTFAHPLMVDSPGDVNGEKMVVIDGRPFTRISQHDGTTVVTGATEYEFQVLRAALQEAWIHGDAHALMGLGTLGPIIYTRWISEGITRRLNLTPLEQLQIAVVAAAFYYELFGEVGTHESDQLKRATQVSRIVSIGADKVLEILGELPVMHTIRDLIEGIKRIIKSPRIEALSTVLLYGILGGSWFGANAREVVAVAIEFPPTFLAMVYTALTNRTYHRSFFAQLTDACARRDEGKNFVRQMDHLLASFNH